VFRISLLLPVILICFDSNAQNLFYSAPVGNYSYAESKVIGHVNNNIIIYNYIWSHSFDMRKSEILVYNDRMQLRQTISLKSIATKFSSVDFINEGDSFSAVVQYIEDEFFVCKLVSFDEEGNVLNTQILERSTSLNDGPYEIIRSPKDKSFALLHILSSDNSGTISIRYHFVRNEQLNHSDTIILPFNRFSSGLDKAVLENNNLLIPMNDNTDSLGTLALYKVDLTNNSSINTIRSLTDGYLVSATISINENSGCYAVVSEWKNNAGSGSKIFLWQLHKDLTDISTDTVIAGTDSMKQCLQNIAYLKFSSMGLQNNTTNIVISSDNIGTSHAGNAGNYFSVPFNSSPAIAQSFYAGRVQSMTASRELNGNGLSAQSSVRPGEQYPSNNNTTPATTNYTRGNQTPKKPQEAKLTILNVDQRNNVKWTLCLNELIEKDFRSWVNEPVIINIQNVLHIIYLKTIKKDKQALGDIVLYPDGTYTIKPIITMNLRYKYFPGQSVQINPGTLIIPCAADGKLVFAKLNLE